MRPFSLVVRAACRTGAAFLLTGTLLQAQAPVIEKVDPPNWWGSHTINPVRVLIRGKHLGGAQLVCPKLRCARVTAFSTVLLASRLSVSPKV